MNLRIALMSHRREKLVHSLFLILEMLFGMQVAAACPAIVPQIFWVKPQI